MVISHSGPLPLGVNRDIESEGNLGLLEVSCEEASKIPLAPESLARATMNSNRQRNVIFELASDF